MSHTIVIAIHGTFARDAAWIDQDSDLKKNITSRKELSELIWLPFQWSGNNSHFARETAALMLTTFIEEIRARYPTSSIFIVAHSHGGNAALMALAKMESTKEKIDGIICLSTPFIHMEDIDFNLDLDVIKSNKLINVLLSLFVFQILLDMVLDTAKEGDFFIFAIINYIYFSILLTSCLFTLLIYKKIDKNSGREVQFKKQLYQYKKISVPILSVRTLRDEALLLLRAISFFDNIPRKFSLVIISATAFVFLAFMVFLFIDVTPELRLWMLTSVGLVIFSFPAIHLSLMAIKAFVRSGPWSWGEGIISGIVSAFSASPTIDGCHNFSEIVINNQKGLKNVFKLNHSTAYSSVEAANVIGGFIMRNRSILQMSFRYKAND